MKKVLLPIFVLIVIYATGCSDSEPIVPGSSDLYAPVVYSTSDAGTTWNSNTIVQAPFVSPTQSEFTGITVISSGICCVIWKNQIWYSNDNFSTWRSGLTDSYITKLKSGSNGLYGIGKTNINSDTGVIYKSLDGIIWQQSYKTYTGPFGLSDIDAYGDFVITVGDTVVVYSTDNGVSWSRASIQNAGRILVTSITGTGRALCIDISYNVYFSSDNGSSWFLRSNVPGKFLPNSAASVPDANLTFMTFSDSKDNPSYVGVYKTTDEGVSWEHNDEGGISRFAVSSQILAAVGRGFFKSTDFGNTWITDTSIGTANLKDIYFQPDGLHGYIASGKLIRH